MIKPPRLLLIEGISRTLPQPIDSWVIEEEFPEAEGYDIDICESCSALLRDEPEITIQGYDEFSDFDPLEKSFFPHDENLIGLRSHIEKLLPRFSGVELIPVAYADWNQSFIPIEERRTREPILACMRVTGRAVGGFVPDLGVADI